jgi:hypothetical protein
MPVLLDPAAHRTMHSQTAPARQNARHHARHHSGPWLQLLSAVLELAGGQAELLHHGERAWASATFSGARQTILLAFTGIDAIAAGEDLIEAFPDHEFTLPRQIVADAAVIGVEHAALPTPRLTVEVELLLLDDC